jgi:hypothetical protein
MRQWATRKKCKFVYLRLDNFLPRIIIYKKQSFNFYKLYNNLLTVEPRAVDPHCFDADPKGVGQPKMCIPPGKILGTPLVLSVLMEHLLVGFRCSRVNTNNYCKLLVKEGTEHIGY